jgi:hypothetical protein
LAQIIFSIFYGLTTLLLAIIGGVYSLVFAERKPPATPLSLPLEPRLEHTHVVAGSGHGKTQILQHMLITHDLEEVAKGRRSLIVMDSQGDLLNNILHLAEFSPRIFGGLSERLVYIDPTDIANPPCLNLFDFGLSRLKNYSPLDREEIINGTLSLYEYLFGALLGAELTNRQGVIFRYLASLLMVVPGATIFTLMDFMEAPELVRPHLAKLDPLSARFFETQFFASTFDTTRQQILMRLWGVLSKSRVLARMFSHTENRLNLYRAMNKGSVILINTAKDLLQQEGCSLFGKFCIALLTQATQERSAIPEARRLPTIAYIDEAHDYFEEGAGINLLLNTARKFQVGLVLSHQNLGQFLVQTGYVGNTLALVHFQTEGEMAPTLSCYPMTGWRRTESGRPATNIRFSTATPMAASVCWAAKPRARRRGPISDLYRPIVVSTNDR